ncbi:hypothetical protein SRHO_G00330000 [Serrasalmus rhombeus]
MWLDVVEFDAGMTVSGGWLEYEYQLVEMRFHWGSKTTNGSEHTLNKHRFPMEMQIVGVALGFADVWTASHTRLVIQRIFLLMSYQIPYPACLTQVCRGL